MKFFSLLHKKYGYIYPKINRLRGSYRLYRVLRALAEKERKDIEPSKAESIFEKGDWDNLIILDACRHDLYEEINGETDYRISLGGKSKEFIQKNFSKGDYSDVVYITANPYFHISEFKDLTGREPEEVFHCVFDVYESEWNQELGTVLPESVLEESLTAEKLFPEKRKIIHFMQPHLPFLNSSIDHYGFAQRRNVDKNIEGVWSKAKRGEVSSENVWRDYKENLREVQKYVNELKCKIKGRTVVTADHGNFMGEGGLWGHDFEGSKAKCLRKVPWDRID